MKDRTEALGDFTATPRVILISLIAVAIGTLSCGVAWVLLRLIGVFTNLFNYGRWSAALVSPPAKARQLVANALACAGLFQHRLRE